MRKAGIKPRSKVVSSLRTTSPIAVAWRGAVICLALHFALSIVADDDTSTHNYVLIEDYLYPEKSRLLIFNSKSTHVQPPSVPINDDQSQAHDLLQSAHAADRTRGLTLLAGNESPAALFAAMTLLFDPDPAVREEAVEASLHHPDADIGLLIDIGLGDPAPRVREIAADFVAESKEQ